MIKLSNITKVFQQGTRTIQALNNVSLHVPAGQIYGVIGASGAGKSTLIRCVNLLERPTEGSVQVGGQELTTLSESELTKARRQIGMIFQHFNLLSSRTVFGNVALPLELDNTPKEEIKRRVTELLDLVGLGDKHDSYPANLSGGQKHQQVDEFLPRAVEKRQQEIAEIRRARQARAGKRPGEVVAPVQLRHEPQQQRPRCIHPLHAGQLLRRGGEGRAERAELADEPRGERPGLLRARARVQQQGQQLLVREGVRRALQKAPQQIGPIASICPDTCFRISRIC